MAKVTSKLQITIPKRVADAFGIAPGDELEFVAGADAIRVFRAPLVAHADASERLALFDHATARQRARQRASPGRRVRKRSGKGRKSAADRGWTREDLYDRARPR